jgi:hypothetical protein
MKGQSHLFRKVTPTNPNKSAQRAFDLAVAAAVVVAEEQPQPHSPFHLKSLNGNLLSRPNHMAVSRSGILRA